MWAKGMSGATSGVPDSSRGVKGNELIAEPRQLLTDVLGLDDLRLWRNLNYRRDHLPDTTKVSRSAFLLESEVPAPLVFLRLAGGGHSVGLIFLAALALALALGAGLALGAVVVVAAALGGAGFDDGGSLGGSYWRSLLLVWLVRQVVVLFILHMPCVFVLFDDLLQFIVGVQGRATDSRLSLCYRNCRDFFHSWSRSIVVFIFALFRVWNVRPWPCQGGWRGWVEGDVGWW